MLLPVRTIPPSETPVSLEQAKAHCRVDHDDDDVLIESLIAAATERVDGYFGILGRALIDQEWTVNYRDWPYEKVRLPLRPVTQIVSVMYWNNATPSVQTEFSASNYSLLEDHLGPYIAWTPDADSPSLADRDDAIEITFVTGYGSAAEDVPQPIRHAILMMVAHWYEHRETVIVGDSATIIPMAAETLLSTYRLQA